MIRTQIQLEKAQHERLKRLAARESKSLAELVREAVDHVLDDRAEDTKWRDLRSVAGAFHDPEGEASVAEDHDDYLANAWEEG